MAASLLDYLHEVQQMNEWVQRLTQAITEAVKLASSQVQGVFSGIAPGRPSHSLPRDERIGTVARNPKVGAKCSRVVACESWRTATRTPWPVLCPPKSFNSWAHLLVEEIPKLPLRTPRLLRDVISHQEIDLYELHCGVEVQWLIHIVRRRVVAGRDPLLRKLFTPTAGS